MDLRGAVSLCTRLCKQKIKKAMQLKGNVEELEKIKKYLKPLWIILCISSYLFLKRSPLGFLVVINVFKPSFTLEN